MQSTLDKPVQQNLGPIDRAALHLGVALIRWGRRPMLGADERRANLVERALARAARDEHVAANRERALLNLTQLTRVR